MNDQPTVKLKDFIPWLRSQPAGRRFEFFDTNNCMLCAFLRETQSIENPSVGGFYWCEEISGPKYDIPKELSKAIAQNSDELTCENVLATLEAKEQI